MSETKQEVLLAIIALNQLKMMNLISEDMYADLVKLIYCRVEDLWNNDRKYR